MAVPYPGINSTNRLQAGIYKLVKTSLLRVQLTLVFAFENKKLKLTTISELNLTTLVTTRDF